LSAQLTKSSKRSSEEILTGNIFARDVIADSDYEKLLLEEIREIVHVFEEVLVVGEHVFVGTFECRVGPFIVAEKDLLG
jgi:hypothetical protein